MSAFCSRRFPTALFRTALFTGLFLLTFASGRSLAQEPGQAVPEFVKAVSFSEVLTGLDDRSVKSYFDRNNILIKAIAERGVGFALGGNAVKDLTKLGASEALLDAIKNGQKKRRAEMDRLSKQFRESNQSHDVTSMQERIATGWQLLDKIGDPDLLVGDESDLRQFVTYLKDTLPKLQKRLHQQLSSSPPARALGP